jgi:hypothetical protein
MVYTRRIAAVALLVISLSAARPSPTAGSSSPDPAIHRLLSTQLSDVRSGERFSLTSFAGEVTIVEGFSVF